MTIVSLEYLYYSQNLQNRTLLCYVKTSHKPQATSHKPQATSHKPFRLGFTLSELLVSLAILGLIAGLTVPSIVVSVQKAQNKTLQKEAIQTIGAIIQDGVMNGDFSSITNWDIQSSSSPVITYFTSKLNAIQCPKNTLTPPCDHNNTNTPANVSNATNNHSGRWVLPNGTKVWFYGTNTGAFAQGANSTGFLIQIDSKPTGTNLKALGGDQLMLACNISETTNLGTNYQPVKPGMCGPWDTNDAIVYNGLL